MNEMNVELFKLVKKAILEEPKRLNMDRWQYKTEDFIYNIPSNRAPDCGTIGCILGWGKFLTQSGGSTESDVIKALPVTIHPTRSNHSQSVIGAELFGITPEQAEFLFLPHKWPQECKEALDSHRVGSRAYAIVVNRTINRFMKDPDQFVQDSAEYD
jgi:hypothetical protein